jgi:hypothetical protein
MVHCSLLCVRACVCACVCACVWVGEGVMSECGLKMYFFLSVFIAILVPKLLWKRLWTCRKTQDMTMISTYVDANKR